MNGAVIFSWLSSALLAGIIGLPLLGYVRNRGALWLQGGRLCLEGVGFCVGMRLWKGSFLEASIVFLLVMLINRFADALYEAGKRNGL